MPELGVHASLLHFEHMFEPMVTFIKFVKPLRMQDKSIHLYIKGVSQLVDITAGGDFLGLCDQKSSYKHVSDFGRLRNQLARYVLSLVI